MKGTEVPAKTDLKCGVGDRQRTGPVGVRRPQAVRARISTRLAHMTAQES